MAGSLAFITLMGVVSLFSDMTHEGARSILGPFLAMTGASSQTVAAVSGVGELCGYSLRLLSGFVADKTHRYWTLVIAGYALQVASVPALALVGQGGWAVACALVILERVAKAVKKPAKNALVSFAASEIGMGKGFAYQEVLDQIGAFSGPLMLFVIARITPRYAATEGVRLLGDPGMAGGISTYRLCFAFLAIPAAITVVFTLLAHHKYPHPETFEKEDDSVGAGGQPVRQAAGHCGASLFADKGLRRRFALYMASILLFAFGFADFPLLSLHASRSHLFDPSAIALLYALAMFTDALSALVFGTLFDKIGAMSLSISTLVAASFAPLVFMTGTRWGILLGVSLWGVGMGAEESVMKACVSSLVHKDMRSRAFGVAETGFGISWCAGSVAVGMLYSKSLFGVSVLSVAALAASSLFAFMMAKKSVECRV